MGNIQNKRSKLLIEFSKRQCVEESTVDLLFKNGRMNVNLIDFNGYTPLTCAAFSGNKYIVKKLIERKDININLQNRYGNTPLIVSCYSSNEYIAKKFINNKEFKNAGTFSTVSPCNSLSRIGADCSSTTGGCAFNCSRIV